MTYLTRSTLALLIFVLLMGPAAAATQGPRVAVSIPPIHSLVAGVMAGIGLPDLIVKGAASPHAYSLKPSDARTLNRANLVFWIGPEMELFLERPLKSLSEKARIVTLIKNESLHLLVDENQHSHDPHIWLDPANAAAIVSVAERELSALDPKNAARYGENAKNMLIRLDKMDQDIRRQLKPVAHIPLLVFHDAYAYFANAFLLNVVGAVVINPERLPGAARASSIRRLIRDSKVRCLFREPQLQSSLLTSLIGDQDTTTVAVLDPLGALLVPGENLYFDLMEGNARSVVDCAQNN